MRKGFIAAWVVRNASLLKIHEIAETHLLVLLILLLRNPWVVRDASLWHLSEILRLLEMILLVILLLDIASLLIGFAHIAIATVKMLLILLLDIATFALLGCNLTVVAP